MALKETLKELETTYTSEHNISSRLTKELQKGEKVLDAEFELKSEILAFDMFPNYHHRESGWGTFFGPMSFFGDTKYPPIEEITADMILYWNNRSEETSNPILAGRYADLVWDLSILTTGKKPSHLVAEKVVKSYVEISHLEGKDIVPVYVFDKLERALEIACSLNNKDLIEACKVAIVSYESKTGEDKWPGLWGRAFDNLVFNKNVTLTETEEKGIIDDLENRLVRVTDKGNLDLNAADRAYKALIKYYSKKNEKHEIKRILTLMERAYEAIEESSAAMQIDAWLKTLSAHYKEYGFKEDYKRVLKRIQTIGKEVFKELKTIAVESQITKDVIDEIVNDVVSGSTKDALHKIASYYIPRKQEAVNHINKSVRNSFMSLFGTNLLDERGIVIAKIGSVDNDLEGHIIQHLSFIMKFQGGFLNHVFDKAVSDHKDFQIHLTSWILGSPAIIENQHDVIKLAINHHFEKRYIEAVHLFVPQFEATIRNLVELLGENILKDVPYKDSDYVNEYINLTGLLNNAKLNTQINEDIITYFKVLYNEKVGWNIRNNICHGISNPLTIDRLISERVLHSFICLGLIRKR